jgi:endonuclease YncB( thermonuclease family)
MRRVVVSFAAIVALCTGAQAANLIGVPRAADGDTLTIGTIRVRLEGIDAPETDQICLDAKGTRWACGIESRDQLVSLIAGGTIKCVSSGVDRYGRALATCWLGANNLNAEMVERGWALAYVQYSKAYVSNQERARTRQVGLWQGAFIAPWDWRHRNQRTEILGALKVPLDAQKILLAPTGAGDAPSAQCTIKGNMNQRGERIYHLPGQQAYPRIKMEKDSSRRWFCTSEEAEAAGYRKALR